MTDLSPIDWAILPLKKYATFSGRSSRAEFWWFFLFTMIVYLVVMFAVGMVGGLAGIIAANPAEAAVTGVVGLPSVVMLLLWVGLFVPTLAVQVRRLHDTDRSGWWIGVFWLFYAAYVAVSFGTVLGATSESTPNLGMAAAVGIFALFFFVFSIVLVVFFCLRGTNGPNRFGEDPDGRTDGEVFA